MSDAYLAVAARDRIRAHADYENKNVNVELDDTAPSTAPKFYVMVIPAGVVQGPAQGSGATRDLLYGLDVAIAIEAPSTARDRLRDLIIEADKSFADHVRNILTQLDFDYTTITNANTSMVADGYATGTCDTFIEPLRLESISPVRRASGAMFARTVAEDVAALVRTMRFRGARLPTART